jgi:RNAse (barnase) inhibitor barstar
MATEYILDGTKFTSLEDFYDEIGGTLIPGASSGRNLDAFNDVLRGGFDTPKDGFILRWMHSEMSREKLGYPETVRQLEFRLAHCHPTNRERVERELIAAQNGQGPTVFDWLLEIIREHGVGGHEAEDNVRLVLE